MSATCGRWKSNRWQRETIVSGILCASVVASTKTTLSGGSSSVLSSALKASRVSMWTSSTMYTLKRPSTGAKAILSRRSRTSSMLRLEAASISMTSRDVPSAMAMQWRQTPQGVAVGRSPAPSAPTQLSALARIRAVLVFPVPRGPAKM